MQYHAALDVFVASHVDAGRGAFLAEVGPATNELKARLRNEERTASLVAHSFWQSYVSSSAFARDLDPLGVPVASVFDHEMLVVGHDETRYSLLLFSDAVHGDPRSSLARPTVADLRHGWDIAFEHRAIRGDASHLADYRDRQLDLSVGIALEAEAAQPFWVIVSQPITEILASVPSPAAGVAVQAGAARSSAGARVRDAEGRTGVTAAAHAVPSGSDIRVNGLSATVASRDDGFTDSCFLVVPDVGTIACRSTNGPLRLMPRNNDVASFDGATSGPKQARIIAANLELPYVDPNLQQTVRTELVTARGDSGAALVDRDGFIVGFCYSRSALDAPAPNSVWIWADAVFRKHDLSVH